jgi:hypothetical protein
MKYGHTYEMQQESKHTKAAMKMRFQPRLQLLTASKTSYDLPQQARAGPAAARCDMLDKEIFVLFVGLPAGFQLDYVHLRALSLAHLAYIIIGRRTTVSQITGANKNNHEHIE